MSQTEPGWYHADGDAPGTVRWWDGTQWVGEPTAPSPQQAGAAGAVGAQVYATWGKRVGARLIDGLLMVAMIIPVVILGAILGSISDSLGAIVIILGYLAVIVIGVYLTVWAQGTTGQSPGKRVMGIELVRAGTNQAPGGGLAIGRWLLDFINGLPLYLGYLWPLWDQKRQTFTDKILSTAVIESNRPKGLFPLFPNGKPF